MFKIYAGAVIAAVTLGGIYAVASTTATNMSAGFSTTEIDGHSRIVAYSTAVQQATSENAAARDQCGLLEDSARSACIAEAAAAQHRARRAARSSYSDTRARPGVVAVVDQPGTGWYRGMDVALYRIHRQLPD